MFKKLTVCLPTYNRKAFIEKQIEFFESELASDESLLNQVNFIVADNSSTDKTVDFLQNKKDSNKVFEVIFNDHNLGLVGNVIKLLRESQSEYVWFVSDDDELRSGILKWVLGTITEHNNLNFVYLNYLIAGKKAVNKNHGLHLDSRKMAMGIFDEGYGSLVFMTACIYKKNNLNELSDLEMFEWLSAPLLYSFYSCSKGGAYVSGEAWIKFRTGNASYASLKRILKLKFEEYIPILESLDRYGYEKKDILCSIQNFLKNQSHAHFLYNFINFKNSLRIYRNYYNLTILLNLPRIIVSYAITIVSKPKH
jgi:glycosyltransferase involved in cell wall biosynthesis